MRMSKLYLVLILLIITLLGRPGHSQTNASTQNGQEVMTKGEAIMLISATDFMKQKIGALVSWTIGYDISKVNRVKLTPTIKYIKAMPKRVPPDGRTVLEVIASVDDPGGLGNIAGVRADLSSIGRLPNTMLVDNGLFGDQTADDGVYTLQTSVSTKIDLGPKELAVAVANKKGWLALAKTTLDVKKNPVIIDASFTPERAKADSKSIVTLTAKVDNPGRLEDLKNVTADLRALGYAELLPLRNDAKAGDAVAGDESFTLQFTVPDFVKSGEYTIRVGAANLIGGYAYKDVVLKVYK